MAGRDPRRARRRDRQRGAIAVEMALTFPILFMILLGGIQIGRALITRHKLEYAVSSATRAAAIGGQTGEAVVGALVRERMNREATLCSNLQVRVRTVPGFADGAPPALEVTAVCTLEQMFNQFVGVQEISSVSAMPLPL